MVFSDRLHSHSGIKQYVYNTYPSNQRHFTTIKQAGEFSNVATIQLAEFKEKIADLILLVGLKTPISC